MEAGGPETDFVEVPGWLNSAMVAYYRGESQALRAVDLPFGLSVVCVAQKPRRSRPQPR